jgi:hypothetical protein
MRDGSGVPMPLAPLLLRRPDAMRRLSLLPGVAGRPALPGPPARRPVLLGAGVSMLDAGPPDPVLPGSLPPPPSSGRSSVCAPPSAAAAPAPQPTAAPAVAASS